MNKPCAHPLRTYRETNHISAATVADKAGTSRVTIFRIEAGQQMPSLDLVSRIIAATGGSVSANDFLPQPATPQAAE